MNLKVLMISLCSSLLVLSGISYAAGDQTQGTDMKTMHSQSMGSDTGAMHDQSDMQSKAKKAKAGNDSCVKSNGKSKSKNCKPMDEE
ncbi:hypothetical protein L3V82_10010 [Thiotrichales bacterium 19S3-7]|nr:hypothetical protein [Thiotrichales bacterium 19S3-7]MCF6802493.1 hypothetical protein [Thiotrichales bacterium 19S3-11]